MKITGNIGFTIILSLFSGLGKQELIYLRKEKKICQNNYGYNCQNLYTVDCNSAMTIIAIGWTRGNKKSLATII